MLILIAFAGKGFLQFVGRTEQNLPGMDHGRMKRKLQITVFVVLLLWIVCAGFLIPALIQDAYAGRSWPVFNGMIRGQHQHSVEYYGALWGRYFWLGIVPLTVALFMALVPVPLRRQVSFISKGLVSVVIFLAICEIGLRLRYWNGETFGTKSGPMVSRFERDFVLNGFDGSRGPVVTGPKGEGEVRILVQGDSISWGQGVRDEREVYPSKLLELLRRDNPRIQMSVLARPGREMDGHLEQILKHGAAIQPDLILYQWYVNDLELGDARGRRDDTLYSWRKNWLFRKLWAHSYFLFLLDYQVNALKPARMEAYEDFMLENFEGDTAEWDEFADTFRAWAKEARKLTPRIGIVLYPHFSGTERLGVLREKVAVLGAATGLEVLDLEPLLGDLRENPGIRMASRFDNHPSALVHERMACAIETWAAARWPEILSSEGASEGQ